MTIATTKAPSPPPFSATFEFVRRGVAIVTLYDPAGQWSGAQRVERSAAATKGMLFAVAYKVARQNAAVKGGRLESFRDVTDASERKRGL